MDAPAEPAPPLPSECVSCGRPLRDNAAFCPNCGQRRGEPPVDRQARAKVRIERTLRQQAGISGIYALVALYAILLGGQLLTFVVAKVSEDFVTEVVGTAILAGIIVVATFAFRSEVVDPLRRPGFRAVGYALVVLASIPIVAVVHAYTFGLDRLFHLHRESELKSFEGQPLAWTFLLFAAAPALFEELGFRGVIFSLLRRSLDPRESILISAIAFGLLHLSVPMLITHVPLGLYLGWLRHRSGSLYPSMLAHFLHNALVVAGVTWSLFPGSGS
jgi:membrane protease YdiL (CAAX protease family)